MFWMFLWHFKPIQIASYAILINPKKKIMEMKMAKLVLR